MHKLFEAMYAKLTPQQVNEGQRVAECERHEFETQQYTDAEKAEVESKLLPFGCENLVLPQVPVVRFKQHLYDDPAVNEYFLQYQHKWYFLIAEVAQMPGHVMLMDFKTMQMLPHVVHTYDLEMVPSEEI